MAFGMGYPGGYADTAESGGPSLPDIGTPGGMVVAGPEGGWVRKNEWAPVTAQSWRTGMNKRRTTYKARYWK